MNKLSNDQIATHFYNLGATNALRGMDKTAMSASAAKALSRIRPGGGRNFLAGAGWTTGGAFGGDIVNNLMGLTGKDSIPALAAGGIIGKLIKDRNTLKAVDRLGMLDRMAVRRALKDSPLIERGAGTLGTLLNPYTSYTPSSNLLAGLSETATNQLVRKRLGL